MRPYGNSVVLLWCRSTSDNSTNLGARDYCRQIGMSLSMVIQLGTRHLAFGFLDGSILGESEYGVYADEVL